MKSNLSRIFILCFCFISLVSFGKKPKWIIQSEVPQGVRNVYLRGVGVAENIDEAKGKAIEDVYGQMAKQNSVRIGVEESLATKEKTMIINGQETLVYTDEFLSKVNANSEKLTVKGLKVTEEYYRRKGNNYEYWVLMSIPKKRFKRPNILAKSLIPGWAQMYKKQPVKSIFIFSSVAGGLITGFYFEKKRSENEILKTQSFSTVDKLFYEDKARSFSQYRNISFGVVGAIYVYNIIDGLLAKGNLYANNFIPSKKFQLYPHYDSHEHLAMINLTIKLSGK